MTHRRHVHRIVLPGVAALIVAASGAGAIEVKTGKWEVTMTTENPMLPRPQVNTTTECVEESDYDIGDTLVNDDTCEILDRESSKTEEKWSMRCQGGGDMPEMTGRGHLRSMGDVTEGEMQMSVTINGQAMQMRHTWKGKYLGPCDG